MCNYRVATRAIVALSVLLLISVSAMAGGTWVKTRIGLNNKASDPLADGKAVYREKDLGLRRTLRVEVEDVSSATSVDVFVDDVNVGTINLLLGAGELEIDTNDGDTVPVVVFGSIVKVRDSSDNHVILRGRNH